MTCSPGREIYSLWGHTAIRVYDPVLHMDYVYNYGSFDFSTPNFYLKFVKGALPYQLTVEDFEIFLSRYQSEQRSVYAQTLRIGYSERQKIYNALEANRQSENRTYQYDFLFDNCSTRPLYIITKNLEESVEWEKNQLAKSYWELLDEYLYQSPWIEWGIQTILGNQGNETANFQAQMFLPDYFMENIETAKYKGENFSCESRLLYQTPTSCENSSICNPFVTFSFGAIVLIGLIHKVKHPKLLNWTGRICLAITGLVGVLIIFLGGFSEHPVTVYNWNLLWANPLNVIIAPALGIGHLARFINNCMNFSLALLYVAVPVWLFSCHSVPIVSLVIIVFMIYLLRTLMKRESVRPYF